MNRDILSELAKLESKSDLLEAELYNLDKMLRKAGFPEGINTLKKTVEDLLSESQNIDFPDLPENL